VQQLDSPNPPPTDSDAQQLPNCKGMMTCEGFQLPRLSSLQTLALCPLGFRVGTDLGLRV